ncbi:6-phosphogluconolactonase [Roseiarcus fermentans]|uniref:6-phosphogluconolactonase n=1 Tax=Roseiarcus fermentans TaxID=1473586 RepID=A0A366FM54_9HYPH|nr:6-phosphogluconolactonase [Roseiarcus fermentans]RBP15783.1 6-phosphogluconolactonase [Roseiarcus fermentans]
MPTSLVITAPDGSVADAIVYPDAGAFVAGAADFVAREAAEAIARRGRFSIALSGGNTPKPIYARLAAAPGLDWGRILVAFGDERCVPPDDPRSNYGMARAALLDHVPIPPENVLRMRGEDPPRAAAAAYAEELARALGPDGRLDLALLGLGDNGHTASLFPGLAALEETERTVVAAYVEVVGMWRLTLTPPAINAARRVAFIVAGADKAEVLARVLQGPRDPEVLPAQAIRPVDSRALWLLDAAAAAKLTAA